MAKKKVRKTKKTGKAKKIKKAKKRAPAKARPIGRVTHFYNHIGVAIVRFNVKTKAGTGLHFKGATTDFKDAPKSMQYDHKPVAAAAKGKQIGIKVKKRVREGDLVYKAE